MIQLPFNPLSRSIALIVVGILRYDVPARAVAGGTSRLRRRTRRGRRSAPSLPSGSRSLSTFDIELLRHGPRRGADVLLQSQLHNGSLRSLPSSNAHPRPIRWGGTG